MEKRPMAAFSFSRGLQQISAELKVLHQDSCRAGENVRAQTPAQ
jgi:hypothetical protein